MAYGDDEAGQSLPKKILGWVTTAVGFGFGKFTGLAFIVPLAISALAVFAIRKFRATSINASAMEGLLIGQTGWMLLGALLSPAAWQTVELDIVISLVLVVWLLVRLSLLPVVLLAIYEAVCLAINGIAFADADPSSPAFRALMVHCLWRVLIIGFAIAYSIIDRRTGLEFGSASSLGEA